MDCTHPVLYNHPDGLRCHICGALISANDAADKPEVQEEKQAPKKKRKTKKEAATDGSDSD